MAMFYKEPQTDTQALISGQLDLARGQLKDRTVDLDKAHRHVEELQATCKRLNEKIAGLEKDQHALTRGYIAMIGDAAAPCG